MPQYMIADCETSGIFDFDLAADAPGQPRLAELGLIFLDSAYQVQAKHSWLIKPEGWEMTPEAAEKTGLTTEFLKENGVPIGDALRMYQAGIEARRVVVGFNIMFDLKQMRAELRRAGMADHYMQTRSLCLMWATRGIVQAKTAAGRAKNPKAEEACAFFGLPAPAHRALPDCESNLGMMLELVKRGALPEPKNPYDKSAKPKKAPRRSRTRHPAEDDINAEIPDFIGGANEDGQ